jgi:hypothetical protein
MRWRRSRKPRHLVLHNAAIDPVPRGRRAVYAVRAWELMPPAPAGAVTVGLSSTTCAIQGNEHATSSNVAQPDAYHTRGRASALVGADLGSFD